MIMHRCNQQTNCSILASTNVFGDPCPGTLKYLEAHYQCVPGRFAGPFYCCCCCCCCSITRHQFTKSSQSTYFLAGVGVGYSNGHHCLMNFSFFFFSFSIIIIYFSFLHPILKRRPHLRRQGPDLLGLVRLARPSGTRWDCRTQPCRRRLHPIRWCCRRLPNKPT